MNGKTAKLLKRFSKYTGTNEKELKQEWYSLNAKGRFEKRQSILQALKIKK